MRRTLLQSFIILALLTACLAIPGRTVHADSGVTAADMISWINGLRTGTYGLPALVENATLDSTAQWTANEMASISAQNHLAYSGYPDASTRAQYAGFGGGKTVVVTEDFAFDQAMTMDKLAAYWADAEHMYPMDKPEYVYIGAGVATANGDTYYVIHAGYIEGETTASTPGVGDTTVATDVPTADSSQNLTAVITSTPSDDGNIYHIVQPGQTLFYIALAYNITLSYLQTENNLTSPDDVQAGTKLLIKPAPTATITPTFTLTPIYPTRTPTLTPQPRTSTPVPTATPTPVPSLAESLPKLDRPSLGLILVILSALGLAAWVFFNFFRPSKAEPTPVVVPQAPLPQPAAPVKKAPSTAKKPAAEKTPEPEVKKHAPRKKKTE